MVLVLYDCVALVLWKGCGFGTVVTISCCVRVVVLMLRQEGGVGQGGDACDTAGVWCEDFGRAVVLILL